MLGAVLLIVLRDWVRLAGVWGVCGRRPPVLWASVDWTLHALLTRCPGTKATCIRFRH